MNPGWLAGLLVLLTAGPAGADPLADKIGKHGVSNADPVLTRDVMKMAKGIVPGLVEHEAKMPHLAQACPEVERTDTMITKSDGVGGWTKEWTFKVCHYRYTMPVEFLPDGSGGTYFNMKTAGSRFERESD